MAGNFLERNKKKSVLALLLLFLRQRKMLVLLLLLLLIASTVFLSPSSKLGLNLARWGFAPRTYSRGDLLAAFRAARTGSRGVSWGEFFGSGGGFGRRPGVPPRSVRLVQAR